MTLDDYQKAAAHSPASKMLISACPGSGKTRTLAARVLYLIEELEIPPQEIVLLTFTRFAAREMKKRLGQWGSYLGFCGTFHAFALAIVQEFGSRRGWEGEWLTLLDENEAWLDEEEVLHEQGYITRQGKWVRFDPLMWTDFKEGMINGSRIPDPENELDKRMMTVWKGCMDRMRAQNVLTFGALVLEALALLDDTDVRYAINRRYHHVLLDEAQDSDASQWSLVRKLMPDTLCVIGDVDQSIYEWRGAQPQLFTGFGAEGDTFVLPNSYRFGINIADPANHLIQNNKDRIEGAIHAIAENEGKLEVVNSAAFERVAEMVKRDIDAGAQPDDICVLSRRHRTLDILSKYLRQEQVPFTRIGGRFSVPSTPEYRALKGYMRLAVNHKDKRAFMAVAASEHLSTGRVLEIREKALANGVSLVQAYGKDPEEWPPKDIDEIEAYLTDHDLDRVYRPAVKYVREVMEYEGFVNLGDTVRYLAMENMQDKLRASAGTVMVATIHAAKGLEWPTVYLVGMNTKQFPSPRAVREERMEEERRLCYVGMSRAEERLVLVHHEEEDATDGPSQFLGEMFE